MERPTRSCEWRHRHDAHNYSGVVGLLWRCPGWPLTTPDRARADEAEGDEREALAAALVGAGVAADYEALADAVLAAGFSRRDPDAGLRESPFVTISALLDAQGRDGEAQMWSRVTKVCEESGEVWRALSGYVSENPRKGRTHTLDDLCGELLDTASAALCAWAHLNNNEGDPEAALLDHVYGTADRLRAALADDEYRSEWAP